MRISTGSAGVLNMININQLTEPTTCYLMLGDKCENNCSFCSQCNDQSRLSRIEWIEAPADTLKLINNSDFRRVCLQCTSVGAKDVEKTAKKITKPVSISYNFTDLQSIDKLSFADRISIPLDAADKHTYEKTKNGDFDQKLSLIKTAGKKYPGKITTHIIIGLGETEHQAKEIIEQLHNQNITIGLFAFTPIKDTDMQHHPEPDIKYYRNIQKFYYKLKQKELKPAAFQTSGCPDCNRPYYNERPSGTIYNHPTELSQEQYDQCQDETDN